MKRRFFCAALAALCAAASGRASGAVLGFERPADAFEPSPGFHLDAPAPENAPAPARTLQDAAAEPAVPPKPPRFWDAKTTAITAGIVMA